MMEKVKLEVEVAKEAYELGEGLASMVLAVKDALKDGFQPGQDLPAVVTAAFTKLVPAVEGMDKLDDELKEDAKAFLDALYLSLGKGVAELLKKAE